MKQKRAYKYRVYPMPEQQHILACALGCCRFVYNWALRQKTDAYYNEQKRLSYKDLGEQLTELKKQVDSVWLSEVSSVPLQQALRHLDKAFINFFEGRTPYPTFHKKRNKQSATYTANAFTWRKGCIMLAKMSEPLNIVWSRPLPEGCKPSSVTITKDSADRYFISILVEDEIAHLAATDNAIGADLGLTSFVVLSDGGIIGNPKFFHKDEKRLAKAQRRHARKRKGSKNRDKARLKVARIHARIADRRRDAPAEAFDSTHTREPASYMWSRWSSRTWSSIQPSVIWAGLNLSLNSPTKPPGMVEPWSRWTGGIHRVNAVSSVVISSTP